jgi:two-component system response regulator FlrC
MKMVMTEDIRSQATFTIAQRAAKTHATVLITGETGVGKEVLARYIHEESNLKEGPFISVNCAALPHNMIEAILFGYEKGAFTGAINSYAGKFEQAQGGTLLLDEISEIPLELQAKLLRALQEREIERLGGRKLISVNLRVIAATNRDLRDLVETGHFRKDLYYRLSVIPIHCAPLRERLLDIIPLAEYFVQQHASTLGREVPSLTKAAKQKLLSSSWPGNIREMDNVIQRALIMTDAAEITEKDIVLYEDMFTERKDNVTSIHRFKSKLEETEAKLIMSVLKDVAGNRVDAAKRLNMSPRTLRYKIAKLRSFGIEVP